jgi:hypothetical protein
MDEKSAWIPSCHIMDNVLWCVETCVMPHLQEAGLMQIPREILINQLVEP